MAGTNQNDVTMMDVLEVMGATIKDAADVADATGLTMEQLRTTKFGSIDADQLRALCVTLRRSTDEVLGIASAPADELERRKRQARATVELEDAAIVLATRARGVAHLLKQWCCADGSGSGAALDLLADTLEDAAEDVGQALNTLHELERRAG